MLGILEISYYTLVIALVMMAIVFVFLPLPKCEEIRNFRISLKVLSLSYVVLSLYCVFKSCYQIQLISLPFLISANAQAHMLALSHINMVNPRVVTRKLVGKLLIPMVTLSILYLISRFYYPHYSITAYHELWLTTLPDGSHFAAWWQNGSIQWEVALRIIWMGYYIAQIVYYIYLFAKEYITCRKQLEGYLAENPISNLRCIFISTVCVALVAFGTMVIPMSLNPKLCALLNYIILVLYCTIGILCMQYPKVFFNISKAGEDNNTADQLPTTTEGEVASSQWNEYEKRIVANRYFAIPGITIQQLALQLGTNRNVLSNLINTETKGNFNSFINTLRIEEAQKRMTEDPSLTLGEISDYEGYTDQANFSRHFKEIAGISPSEWRRQTRP